MARVNFPSMRIAGRDFFKRGSNATLQTRAAGRGYSGNLNSGGLYNQNTGMGTSLDKSESNLWAPTRYYSRQPLEILCSESWVAHNAINQPIDDQFIRWRHYPGADEGAVDAIEEASEDLRLQVALNRAMKAGDQYGTGVVVMVTAEDSLDTQLDPRKIRPGDLKALHYFDRYDLSVTDRVLDFGSPFFGEPEWYNVHPSRGIAPQRVHRSRILRFDGIPAITKSGYTVYDYDFGLSWIVPLIKAITQDSAAASAIAHMIQEASIPVLHISGLRETIAGGGDPDEASPEQIGADINQMKSIYRLLMLDEAGREEFMRVAVQFGGLSDLFDKFQDRVAAARGIPQTRFNGNPPTGMSATGESDMKNYILMMEANRSRMLKDPLRQLDIVLARHVGLKEPLDYDWESLLELSDKEVAEAQKLKHEALDIAVKGYWMDEDEAREAINGDPMIGQLEGPAPEAPDPMEAMEAEAEIKAKYAPVPPPPSGNGNGASNGNSNGNGRYSRV